MTTVCVLQPSCLWCEPVPVPEPEPAAKVEVAIMGAIWDEDGKEGRNMIMAWTTMSGGKFLFGFSLIFVLMLEL